MVIALTVAAVLAVIDWVGVVRDDQRLRWVGKPGVMVALIVAALFADGAPSAVKAWFIVALVLSLIGDVALLLPEQWFMAGLVAFLLAHLAYVEGMLQLDLHAPWGAVIVLVAIAVVGRRILGAVRSGSPPLLVPVTVYLVVISTMAITAWATGQPWLIVAAMLFFASDATLGWHRFVTPVPAESAPSRPAGVVAPLAVMVTYHAAQACFVAFLLTR
jgi:uncharacterized membrane protein YhhN